MAAKKEAATVNSAEQGIQREAFVLRGMSKLVVHAFGEKSKKEIRDKQAKVGKKAKEARDTEAEFLASRYLNSDGCECVPITAIKKSLISAATAMDDLTKVGLRQALFVSVEGNRGAELVPIETVDGKPATGVKREDAVTIGINTRGLAYRPEYDSWQLRVVVEFNPRIVSRDQLIALIDQAGWGVGICEGRPEKTSALGWGRFERVTSA